MFDWFVWTAVKGMSSSELKNKLIGSTNFKWYVKVHLFKVCLVVRLADYVSIIWCSLSVHIACTKFILFMKVHFSSFCLLDTLWFWHFHPDYCIDGVLCVQDLFGMNLWNNLIEWIWSALTRWVVVVDGFVWILRE
jgi:hypothetical protein